MAIPFRERGRDRSGCDCYGIARLILIERAGITLPLFHVESEAIAGAARAWLLLDEAEAKLFDIVALRAISGSANSPYSHEFHMGLVTRPGWLVHSEELVGVAHLPFTHPSLTHRSRRFYRHPDLA